MGDDEDTDQQLRKRRDKKGTVGRWDTFGDKGRSSKRGTGGMSSEQKSET